jgi:predicted lysophospholipase L1 biosynthesis ABC-type transport system permease subunit
MKALTFAMRSFGRELRSGEVVVLLSAVILAVAALTAVGFLTIPSPMHGGIWPPSTSSVPRTWCRFPRSCSRETRVH